MYNNLYLSPDYKHKNRIWVRYRFCPRTRSQTSRTATSLGYGCFWVWTQPMEDTVTVVMSSPIGWVHAPILHAVWFLSHVTTQRWRGSFQFFWSSGHYFVQMCRDYKMHDPKTIATASKRPNTAKHDAILHPVRFNSLASEGHDNNFRSNIFKIIIQNSSLGTRSEIALRWMPQKPTKEKSSLTMSWWRQEASHYVSKCWPTYMPIYGATLPKC